MLTVFLQLNYKKKKKSIIVPVVLQYMLLVYFETNGILRSFFLINNPFKYLTDCGL